MRRTHKPVRKCYDCGLNLGDRCGVFEYPHDKWQNGHKCPGYRNEVMLQEFLERNKKRPFDLAKARRQEMQKLRATHPHYQRCLTPAARLGT